MRTQTSAADRVIAGLARRADGVVTRQELLQAGISARQIQVRLDRGSLLIVFRGVFRVGHAAPSLEADYLAAVKACGEGAVLSGRAAAHLWSLTRGTPPPAEVTTRFQRRIKGVHTKRSRLDAADATTWKGIPVTTIARTLVDLAAVLKPDDLARAFHEATVRYRTTPEDVDQALARKPNTQGASALRRVVRGDTHITLSRLEAAFLRLLKRAGLPPPEANRNVDGRYVDCRWPAQALTVELDSYRFHNSRHAWQQDRKRERDAYRRGDQFRRYTPEDVFEDPRAMLRELRALLLSAAPPSTFAV